MNGLKTSSKSPDAHIVLKIVAQHNKGETVILQSVAPSIQKIEEYFGISIDVDNLKLEIEEIDYEQSRIS